MTSINDHDRFEELDAGRVLGDLSAEETREWEELSQRLEVGPDESLDLVAAALASEIGSNREETLPSDLADRLFKDIASQAPPAADVEETKVIRPTFWNRFSSQAGWAVAALLAALLIANLADRGSETGSPSVAEAKAQLLESDSGLLSQDFGGVGDYEGMKGDVVWSDQRQEGYMTLQLPTNDPSKKQYQLWIVDPERDEAPVDGGVFDIPAGESDVIVPIDAKLAIADPKAFVITLEQPGGVVKSRQEIVVALAAL